MPRARILVVDDSATIRKVVGAILERNAYSAALAPDGQAALEALADEGDPFDLVLLDFVMPKMNGYQFCRLVRQNGRTAGLPVVLMSAKAGKIRDQFVQQTGALDAITKPFDAQALVAVIENALRRVQSGHASSLRLPELEDEEAPGEPDATDGPRFALAGDLGIIPMGAVLQLLQVEGQSGLLTVSTGSSLITVTLRGGLIDLVQSRGTKDEFRLGRYFIEEGLITREDIDKILIKDGSLNAPPPPDTSPELSPADGEPETMRLGPKEAEELIRRAEAEAQSEPLKMDATTPDGVPRAVPRLLGHRLLALGRVTEEQLKNALVRQSSELVYELLRWPSGRFEFKRCPPRALAAAARLGLTVPGVVMEGFRRVDEWRGLERAISDFEGVLVRDALALTSLPEDRLAKIERTVLDAIDGDRTIREVVAVSHMSSFDACRVLAQLLEARLVRRKPEF